MKRQTLLLLILGIVFAAVLFVLFRLFLDTKNTGYATEIAAAFMGALVTVVITMILLNRQSEPSAEGRSGTRAARARSRTCYRAAQCALAARLVPKQKIAVYGTLIDRLESIMRKGEVSLEDEIAIQMLNLKLSFFASTEVLQKFNEFARQFSLVAADRKVTGEERTELLGTLGELSTSIRHDLSSQEDLRTERKLFSEEELKNLVMGNVNSLFGKTTPKHFLDSCSTEARDYFSRLFARLDSEDLPYWMGTKGFSVNRIFRAYPTFGSKLSGIYLRLDQVAEDRRDEVRQTLARLTGRPLEDFRGDKQISFSPEELSPEGVCEVVRSAGGDWRKAGRRLEVSDAQCASERLRRALRPDCGSTRGAMSRLSRVACIVVLVLVAGLAGCYASDSTDPTNSGPFSQLVQVDIPASGIIVLVAAEGPSEYAEKGELYLKVRESRGSVRRERIPGGGRQVACTCSEVQGAARSQTAPRGHRHVRPDLRPDDPRNGDDLASFAGNAAPFSIQRPSVFSPSRSVVSLALTAATIPAKPAVYTRYTREEGAA